MSGTTCVPVKVAKLQHTSMTDERDSEPRKTVSGAVTMIYCRTTDWRGSMQTGYIDKVREVV
jgi:hypothetical protein